MQHLARPSLAVRLAVPLSFAAATGVAFFVHPLLHSLGVAWVAVPIVFGGLGALVAGAISRAVTTRRLLELLEAAGQDGFWHHDFTTGHSYFSRRWYELLGYEAFSFPASMDAFLTRVHPDDRGPTEEILNRFVEERRDSFRTTLRMKTATGGWIWLQSRGTTVTRDHQGRPKLVAGVHSDITDLKRTEERIAAVGRTNPVSGLSNRLGYNARVGDYLQKAARELVRHPRGLVLLNLRGFRETNRAYGRETADAILAAVGAALQALIHSNDMVFHFDADTFAIFITPLEDRSDLILILERIRTRFAAPFAVRNEQIRLIPRMGVSTYPDDGDDPTRLVLAAEDALNRAKQSDRSFVFFTPSLDTEVQNRAEIMRALEHAVEQEEFRVWYQPICNGDGVPVACEALVRWDRPGHGIVAPGAFIGHAESSGLIVHIGNLVLQQVFSDFPSFGPGLEYVSVNISARQLQDSRTRNSILSAIKHSGLEPGKVVIEITESTLMHRVEEALGLMERLVSNKVRFSIDDFGTGYSSLSYLRSLPAHALKIDRSFISDIESDRRAEAIVQAILSLAEGLGLDVVAEGVETRYQLDRLQELGCRYFQGYLTGRPEHADALVRRMQEVSASN